MLIASNRQQWSKVYDSSALEGLRAADVQGFVKDLHADDMDDIYPFRQGNTELDCRTLHACRPRY